MKKRRVFLPLLLSLVLLCSFVLPAFAASYQNGSTGKVTVSGVWAFHGGRQPGEDSSTSNGGNRANHYNNRLYWYEGYSIDILQMDGSQYTPQYNGKTYFYCVHKWVNYGTGNRKFYVDPTGQGNLMNSPYWKNGLNQTQRDLLMLVSMYGFPARTPQQLGVSTVDDAYAATQAIIWEIVTGRRNKSGLVSGYKSSAEELNSGIPAAKNNVNYFHDCYMLYAYDGNGHKKGEATPALTAYNKIIADMAKHDTLASFANTTLTLKWDGASKTYKGSLTDKNGMLANSSLTSVLPSGLSAKISGNTITITASKPFGTTTIHLKKNLSELHKISPLAVLEVTSGTGQEMLCGVMNDPKPYSFSVRTAQGAARIIKESEDGVVSGLQFRVTGNGIDKTYTTGSKGQITDTLPAGTYTVTEVNTPGRYNTPASQSITVPDGGTATVTFSNTLKKGYVEIYKTDTTTGKPLAGAVFGIYNSANTRIGGLTTNSDGYAKSGLLPYGDGYYLLEEQAPEGYVLDTTKHYFNVRTNGQTITIRTNNQSQMGQITVQKNDGETGEAVTSPATFDIRAASDIKTPDGTVRLKAGELADTVTTKNGVGTTKQLYLGDYLVTERTAPDGYVQDGKQYPVSLEYAGQTVKIVTESVTVPNAPQKGTITVHKTDSETGKPVTEAEAVFEIHAKTDIVTGDGTVRYQAGELVDTITTTDGTATSKPLYLGVYIVTEKTAPEGYVLNPEPQEVTLRYGGQTVELVTESVTFANAPQKGQIVVQKNDAESGKPITASPAVFEIRAKADIVTADGTIRCKAGELVDTLTTEKGVVTSKPLYLGTYTVTEKTAPHGYVQDTTVYDVTLFYGEQTVELATEGISIDNAPQMGTITIEKRDKETGKPIILSDATFQIHAKTDIITGDGIVHYKAGELVDTLTTVQGVIASKPLYLGAYTITEITAPEGYILDSTPHDVTLSYGGQSVELVSESLSLDNVPQMGTITIRKVDKETGKPITGADAVFELRAKEDIVTADGTIRHMAGELVDTLTTKDGVVTTGLLYLGTYTITEVKAPEGYLLDDTPHDVTLVYGGQDVALVTESLTVENAPQMGQIVITKVDSETGKPIILSPATFSVYAASDIITPDGTVRYTKGQLVDTLVTENGVATSKLLYLGDYIVIETIAPEGYILDTTPYEAVLLYDGQVATVKRMAMSGPVLEAGQGGQSGNPPAADTSEPEAGQPGTTVPDTSNNASLTIPNQPIPKSPKTGDDSKPWLWAALMGISAVGTVTLGVIGLKKRKKEDAE